MTANNVTADPDRPTASHPAVGLNQHTVQALMPQRRSSCISSLLAALVLPGFAYAQTLAAPQARPAHVSRYLDHAPLLFQALVPQPPAPDTPQAAEELAAVHRLQSSRTPSKIKAAQRDDRDESIFAFDTVMGPRFAASNLPLTAMFSQHLREESASVNPALKIAFNRPRPFVADLSVIAVCERTASNSYPSGHAMVGYLEAFALAQMVPEKADAILHRADDYARNRLVCGVHYPSDIVASHILAAALFGALATSPRFQQEFAAAKAEVRKDFAL